MPFFFSARNSFAVFGLAGVCFVAVMVGFVNVGFCPDFSVEFWDEASVVVSAGLVGGWTRVAESQVRTIRVRGERSTHVPV